MKKKETLILSTCEDLHAASVHSVLSELKEPVHLYDQSDIIGGGDVSVSYEDDGMHLGIGTFSGKLSDIGAVWNRRHPHLFSYPPRTHPADVAFLKRSARSVVEGLAAALDECFPVNPAAASRQASSKMNQLKLAREVGFRAPRTLISNSYQEISLFLESEKGACVKPFYLFSWKTDDGMVVSTTAKLDSLDGLGSESVSLIPAIYQEYIEKKYEYRLTIFGNYSIATRINSQKSSSGSVDWRNDISYLEDLVCETLPPAILSAAKRMMRRMGLRFATFDLALTNDGEYVFFEVNEMGQFLWQEIYCEDCVLLEPFCRFLLSMDDGFEWDKRNRSISLSAKKIADEVLSPTSIYAKFMSPRPGDAEATKSIFVDETKILLPA